MKYSKINTVIKFGLGLCSLLFANSIVAQVTTFPNKTRETRVNKLRVDTSVAINTSVADSSAILDIVSSNKGILLPRVNLTSSTLQIGTAPNATGLLVYNSGTTLTKGYYFWNGTEWRIIDNSTVVAPSIATIQCASAALSPTSYTSGVAYTGVMTVTYTGGNGGTYSGGDSTVVNGLKFKLQGAKLAYGTGNLVFNVTGTPTVSSPTTTSVTMNSTLVPFYTGAACNAVVGDNNATILTTVKILPLTSTSDNGVSGYAASITTPDGKYSIRFFCDGSTTAYADANIQIRNNNPTADTIQGVFTFDIGGAGGTRVNQLILTDSVWSGHTSSGAAAANATPITTTSNIALGNAGVYDSGIPEYRTYKWMSFGLSASKKKFYIAKLMMGSTNPSGTANTTNCPGGTCAQTKCYLSIEEVTSN